MQKFQVALLGLNSLFGRVSSLLLKRSNAVKKLMLYDDQSIESAKDISIINTGCAVEAYLGREQLNDAVKDADIVIIGDENLSTPHTAFDLMAPKICDYAKAIASNSPNAIVVVAASPINILVPLLSEALIECGCYDCNRVIGATAVDNTRASSILAAHLKANPQKIVLPVIGGASKETRVPLFSQAKPAVTLSDDNWNNLVMHIKEADSTIFSMKKSPEALNKAYSTIRFLNSVLAGLRGGPENVSIAFSRTSQIPNVEYFALPVQFGRFGIQHRFGLPKIFPSEKDLVNESIMFLKKDIEHAKQFFKSKESSIEICSHNISRRQLKTTENKSSIEVSNIKEWEFPQEIKAKDTEIFQEYIFSNSKLHKYLKTSIPNIIIKPWDKPFDAKSFCMKHVGDQSSEKSIDVGGKSMIPLNPREILVFKNENTSQIHSKNEKLASTLKPLTCLNNPVELLPNYTSRVLLMDSIMNKVAEKVNNEKKSGEMFSSFQLVEKSSFVTKENGNNQNSDRNLIPLFSLEEKSERKSGIKKSYDIGTNSKTPIKSIKQNVPRPLKVLSPSDSQLERSNKNCNTSIGDQNNHTVLNGSKKSDKMLHNKTRSVEIYSLNKKSKKAYQHSTFKNNTTKSSPDPCRGSKGNVQKEKINLHESKRLKHNQKIIYTKSETTSPTYSLIEKQENEKILEEKKEHERHKNAEMNHKPKTNQRNSNKSMNSMIIKVNEIHPEKVNAEKYDLSERNINHNVVAVALKENKTANDFNPLNSETFVSNKNENTVNVPSNIENHHTSVGKVPESVECALIKNLKGQETHLNWEKVHSGRKMYSSNPLFGKQIKSSFSDLKLQNMFYGIKDFTKSNKVLFDRCASFSQIGTSNEDPFQQLLQILNEDVYSDGIVEVCDLVKPSSNDSLEMEGQQNSKELVISENDVMRKENSDIPEGSEKQIYDPFMVRKESSEETGKPVNDDEISAKSSEIDTMPNDLPLAGENEIPNEPKFKSNDDEERSVPCSSISNPESESSEQTSEKSFHNAVNVTKLLKKNNFFRKDVLSDVVYKNHSYPHFSVSPLMPKINNPQSGDVKDTKSYKSVQGQETLFNERLFENKTKSLMHFRSSSKIHENIQCISKKISHSTTQSNYIQQLRKKSKSTIFFNKKENGSLRKKIPPSKGLLPKDESKLHSSSTSIVNKPTVSKDLTVSMHGTRVKEKSSIINSNKHNEKSILKGSNEYEKQLSNKKISVQERNIRSPSLPMSFYHNKIVPNINCKRNIKHFTERNKKLKLIIKENVKYAQRINPPTKHLGCKNEPRPIRVENSEKLFAEKNYNKPKIKSNGNTQSSSKHGCSSAYSNFRPISPTRTFFNKMKSIYSKSESELKPPPRVKNKNIETPLSSSRSQNLLKVIQKNFEKKTAPLKLCPEKTIQPKLSISSSDKCRGSLSKNATSTRPSCNENESGCHLSSPYLPRVNLNIAGQFSQIIDAKRTNSNVSNNRTMPKVSNAVEISSQDSSLSTTNKKQVDFVSTDLGASACSYLLKEKLLKMHRPFREFSLNKSKESQEPLSQSKVCEDFPESRNLGHLYNQYTKNFIQVENQRLPRLPSLASLRNQNVI